MVDLDKVAVHKARPIPDATRGIQGSRYAALWQRMAPGDCVELPDRQAHGFAAYAKGQKHQYVVRRLNPGIKGFWRTA